MLAGVFAVLAVSRRTKNQDWLMLSNFVRRRPTLLHRQDPGQAHTVTTGHYPLSTARSSNDQRYRLTCALAWPKSGLIAAALETDEIDL